MSAVIGVVAHIGRAQQAYDVADLINAASLTFDDGSLGCTRNHLRVWSKYADTEHDWVVVVEDDSVPCPNFREQLDLALAVAPTPIVGLYLGRSYPPAWQDSIRHIQNDTAHWAVSTHLLHGVGTAIRADLVQPMLDWVGRLDPEWPIDDAITDWARGSKIPVGYTRPSLLDHADGPPLITERFDGGRRDKPRVAWDFGTRPYWGRSKVSLP